MALPDSTSFPRRRDLRWFGAILALFFGIVGGVCWLAAAPAAAGALWSLGAGLALAYYAIPPLRLPLYRAWMTLVRPVGWLVSHGVLAAIFYGLITPMALVMRAFGRDRLGRRPDPSAGSYWTSHDPGGDTARYFRQT